MASRPEEDALRGAVPVTTMIDIGVASPSAQGQAMIRTATALTSPYTQLGMAPKPQPKASAR